MWMFNPDKKKEHKENANQIYRWRYDIMMIDRRKEVGIILIIIIDAVDSESSVLVLTPPQPSRF